jgi:hypothetical protein
MIANRQYCGVEVDAVVIAVGVVSGLAAVDAPADLVAKRCDVDVHVDGRIAVIN